MSEKIRLAAKLLDEAAREESCSWCRSHIEAVRDDAEILYQISILSENLRTHPKVLQALKSVGKKMDDMMILAAVSKIIQIFLRRSMR